MKYDRMIVTILVSLLAAAPGRADDGGKGAGAAKAGAEPNWSARMAELGSTLSGLLPFLFDKQKFEDPKNGARIQELTKKFAELSHQVGPQKGSARSPDPDPVIRYMSSMFEEDIRRAVEGLRQGNRSYAQATLQGSVAYCIACHSRSNVGPQFPGRPAAPGTATGGAERFRELAPSQRLVVLAATRRFDAALDEFNEVAKGLGAVHNIFEVEKAGRVALAIAVRVKRDPMAALDVVNKLESAPQAPSSLKGDIKAWRAALVRWNGEKKDEPKGGAEQLAAARALIQEARKRQEFPLDHKGDIEFLRASAVLHDYIRENPESRDLPEALFLNGTAYEALRDLGFWSLHEAYYQVCIEKAPRTEIAGRCFERYEDSILAGYTGTRGTDLPAAIKRKVDELKKTAGPAARGAAAGAGK